MRSGSRHASFVTRLPNLFIVGAPKSGTTSIYEYLRDHPDVYMADVKEPSYFAPDVVVGLRKRLRFGEDQDAYMALFSHARNEKLIGEASATYLTSHVAASHILKFQPTARLIVMLRNPVEMMYALHNERVSHGVETLTDFAEALAADDSRRAGHQLPAGCTPLGAVYRDKSRYGEQLARLFETVPRERVHVIIFEDFVADPRTSFRSLLEFLDVDPAYEPATFAVHNPSHRLRGGLVRGAVESRPVRWIVGRLMPNIVGQSRTSRLTRRFRHSRLRRRTSTRPHLPGELRRTLEQEAIPDVERLGELLGRDLRGLWFGRSPHQV